MAIKITYFVHGTTTDNELIKNTKLKSIIFTIGF